MTREIVALSLGAGWQSSAMACLLDEGGLPGFPRPDCAVFADTRAEPPWVYQTVSALGDTLSYPVLTVSRGDLEEDLWAGIEGRPTRRHPGRRMPFVDIPAHGHTGIMPRRCTEDYKIMPIRRLLRNRYGWPLRVRMYLGISVEEIVRIKPSRVRYITNEYPLVERRWRRQDCMRYMGERHPGIPVGRSACYFCPFHSSQEWENIGRRAPELMQRALRIDKVMREMPGGPYSLSRTGSLAKDMEDRNRPGRLELQVPGDECSGHCMT